MKQKRLPAWQQVVQVALGNVPGAKDGHDAWEQLNVEEKAAVMDFLAEHCGADARAKLDEACGKRRYLRGWRKYLAFLGSLAFVAGFAALLYWLEEKLELRLQVYLLMILIMENLRQAWNPPPDRELQTIWRKHVNTHYGTTLALNDMHKAVCAPPRDRRKMGSVIGWAVLLALYIPLGVMEWTRHQPPSVPRQIVFVLEDAAEGRASLADAQSLLEGWSDLRQWEHIAEAWKKTTKWSDERYLAAALAVRQNHPNAAEYAREALLTTRLGSLDTPEEAAQFAALLALCDADTAEDVRARVEAVEFPAKAALTDVLQDVSE